MDVETVGTGSWRLGCSRPVVTVERVFVPTDELDEQDVVPTARNVIRMAAVIGKRSANLSGMMPSSSTFW